jgi:hypothetical protein
LAKPDVIGLPPAPYRPVVAAREIAFRPLRRWGSEELAIRQVRRKRGALARRPSTFDEQRGAPLTITTRRRQPPMSGRIAAADVTL